jgi:hypothetical protein
MKNKACQKWSVIEPFCKGLKSTEKSGMNALKEYKKLVGEE